MVRLPLPPNQPPSGNGCSEELISILSTTTAFNTEFLDQGPWKTSLHYLSLPSISALLHQARRQVWNGQLRPNGADMTSRLAVRSRRKPKTHHEPCNALWTRRIYFLVYVYSSSMKSLCVDITPLHLAILWSLARLDFVGCRFWKFQGSFIREQPTAGQQIK